LAAASKIRGILKVDGEPEPMRSFLVFLFVRQVQGER